MEENSRMDIPELIDLAKTRRHIKTDYGFAEDIGLPQARITQWRKGKTAVDDYNLSRLCDYAGISFEQGIAIRNFHREKDPIKKRYWELMQHGPRIAATILAYIVAVITSMPGNATETNANSSLYNCMNTQENLTFYKFPNFFRVYFYFCVRCIFATIRPRVCKKVSIRSRDPMPAPSQFGWYMPAKGCETVSVDALRLKLAVSDAAVVWM